MSDYREDFIESTKALLKKVPDIHRKGYVKVNKVKCKLCSGIYEQGIPFYNHLEDVHLIPIRMDRVGEDGKKREETHDECLERFKFEHKEFGTDKCWCPECINDIQTTHE